MFFRARSSFYDILNFGDLERNRPKNLHIKLNIDEPATSEWRIGWWTPTFIIACYVAALFTALAHLLLFTSLDGSAADGAGEKVPQAYINTASHLLANAFQIFLQASLSTSFVQYLWLILRRSALRVSAIENLFSYPL